ncbi:hypothetical protein N9891_01535 [bacterium]|nr:hypothetical protein [bacterium]
MLIVRVIKYNIMKEFVYVEGEALNVDYHIQSENKELCSSVKVGGVKVLEDGVHLLLKKVEDEAGTELKWRSDILQSDHLDEKISNLELDLGEKEANTSNFSGARKAHFTFSETKQSPRDPRNEKTPNLKCWRTADFKIESNPKQLMWQRSSFSQDQGNIESKFALILLAPGAVFPMDRRSGYFDVVDKADRDVAVVLLASSTEQIALVAKELMIKKKALEEALEKGDAPKEERHSIFFTAIISARALAADIDMPRDTTYETIIHKISKHLNEMEGEWLAMLDKLVVRLSNSACCSFSWKSELDRRNDSSDRKDPEEAGEHFTRFQKLDGVLHFDGKRPVDFKEPGIGVIESYGYTYLLSAVSCLQDNFKFCGGNERTSSAECFEDFVSRTISRACLACNILFMRGLAFPADILSVGLDSWEPISPIIEAIEISKGIEEYSKKLESFKKNIVEYERAVRIATETEVLPFMSLAKHQYRIPVNMKTVLAPEDFWRATNLSVLGRGSGMTGKGININDPDLDQMDLSEAQALSILDCLSEDQKLTLADLYKPTQAKTGSNEFDRLSLVRCAALGKLKLVDRPEIEDYLYLQNLLMDYDQDKDNRQPLSIAVFGPPGCGKSFGVNQLVDGLAKAGVPFQTEPLTFNLSQMAGVDDLIRAFHRVRSACLDVEKGIPIVFFDEFDSSRMGEDFYWLKYFLAPMQDGEFSSEGESYTFGRAVFIFAGGINQSMSEMNGRIRNPNFSTAKGPDFLSRIKGVLNVRGINASFKREERGIHMVKRAILLSYFLKEERKMTANKLMTPQLAEAFLKIPSFKHGVRSMQAIVRMSHILPTRSFRPSDLPPPTQLNLHVDARRFWDLIRSYEESKFVG